MKTTLKRIFVLLLTAVLFGCAAIPCLANTQNGKITVTLEDDQKNKISPLTVNICQIATLNNTGYYPTAAFENSGLSIAGVVNNPNETVTKTLVDYIKDNRIHTVSAVSANGTVSFDNLDLGIWVVFPEEDERYIFNPYIVFLPFESGGQLHYEITSAPKLEDHTPNAINIYVVKKWEDKNNASKKRPASITVELLNGSAVVDSVTLSESNGWSHTFPKLAKDGSYSVKEKAVPDYQASYSGDAVNGFVITNTYAGEKLPQTGQYWWPIILMSIAGTCFVLLGVYEIGVKKNGKKK